MEVNGRATWSSTAVNAAWNYRDEVTVTANVTAYFRVYYDAEGNIEDLVVEGDQTWSASASGGGHLHPFPDWEPTTWTYSGCDRVSIGGFYVAAERALYLSFSTPYVWQEPDGKWTQAPLAEQLNSKFAEQNKGKIVFAKGSLEGQAGGGVDISSNPFPGESTTAHMTASFTASGGNPPEVEVVIIPPENYAGWVPQAGASEKQPGSQLNVRVEIRPKDTNATANAEGVIRIDLVETSQERGICLNAPPEDKAVDDYDLRIIDDDPTTINVGDEGQWAETIDKVSYCEVRVTSFDGGAYGRLQAQATINGRVYHAHVEGQSGKAALTIPLDEDGDHIADSWEKEKGVASLGADWEEASIPGGQRVNGDGISLYEKYRGFKFRGRYERLEPKEKYVFVYDEDNLVLPSLLPDNAIGNFITASKCRIRTLRNDEWTGRGSYAAAKRIVNFNSGWGRVTDQHALDVRAMKESTPLPPEDYRTMYRQKFGQEPDPEKITTGGAAFWDITSPYPARCPGGNFMILVYLAHLQNRLRLTVEYNTTALPRFTTAVTNGMSAEDLAKWQAELAAEVDRYIGEHMGDFHRALYLSTVRVTTHELGHGIGIDDIKNSKHNAHPRSCFMPYIKWTDFDPDANDRLEKARRKWPTVFCTSTEDTKAGLSCWRQIRVTDNEGK